ncbi:MAG: hypothetical protein JWL60_1410 [Gemmatimonadetes bacterium]|jgi:uncharacterized repeat protein (TIGR01451 family)|nr:hypothetical protein [Gemmatimonadota bacterium]
MLTSLKRLVYAGMFLLPFAAAPLQAQNTPIVTSPTAEGATITNTASASYTDANGNTYTPVSGSATVTVGFLAAPNPSGVVSVTPGSPSLGNTVSFAITNSGNGLDSVSVSITAPGLSVTKYQYNGVDYTTLALLNAHLDTINIAAGAALPFPVVVVYDVGPSSGGATLPITIVATSMRTPAVGYNWITDVLPPAAFGVTVGPDGGSVARVPTNTAPAYSASFLITNTGNTSNTYSLSRALTTANGVVTLGALSQASITLAAGASGSVTVAYTVADVAATDNIQLSASGNGNGSASDAGDITVSVSKAAVTIAKAAYASMVSVTPLTNSAADAIVPGTTFFYKLSVTNAVGAAPASGIVITDVLPGSLAYVSSAGDVPADWVINEVSGTVTATLNGAQTIAASATRFIWIGVRLSTVTTTR